MIVVCGGTKGGTGKSTIATNLAVIRSLAGGDVLLVDADDQESAADFTILRNDRLKDGAGYTGIKLSDTAVRTEIIRLKKKYKDIVIDTGGRDTASQRAAFTVADIVLVPFVPRSFDLWTVERTGRLIEEMKSFNPKLRAYTILNRADPRGTDNSEAAEALKQLTALNYLDTPLGARKAFSNAAGEGLAVTELKPQDQKATEEMLALYSFVFGREQE